MLRNRITRAMIALTIAILSNGCEREVSEKKELIPLQSIYSTRRQKEMKVIDLGQCRDAWTKLSNNDAWAKRDVYLVGGATIEEAVTATNEAVAGGSRGLYVASKDGKNKAWMVALLGTTGSSPPAWTMESVERSPQRIRVSYNEPKRFDSTADIRAYYYWIPLGVLEAGDYELELFNRTDSKISLMRRIKVDEEKK